MPITYGYDADSDLVLVEFSGDISAADVVALYAGLKREPWLRRGMRFLADNRGVRTLPPSGDVEAAAYAAVRAAAYIGDARIAVVVPDPTQFGVIRQFDALSDSSGARMRPFYREDEARAWLAGAPA